MTRNLLCTHRGEVHLKKAEMGVMKPQAKNFWHPPEARREARKDSPSGLPKGTKPSDTLYQISGLQSHENKFLLF